MIEKIIKWIVSHLPQDKLLHICGGAVISGLFLGLFLALKLPFRGFFNWAGGLAFLVAVAAGIGKEIYDSKHRGHSVEWKDAVATALGGLIAVLYAEYIVWCGGGYLTTFADFYGL